MLWEIYKVLWKEMEERLNVSLESFLKNNASIISKIITRERKFKTKFHGADIPFHYGVKTTTIL